MLDLVAEFIRIKKWYTVSSIRDHIIPESLKCSNSATKFERDERTKRADLRLRLGRTCALARRALGGGVDLVYDLGMRLQRFRV